jgi:hypothetical protein
MSTGYIRIKAACAGGAAQEMQGLDSQALLDLLQRAAEDAALMPLDDEGFDDLVPRATVAELLHALVRSLLAFLAAICPTPRR